MKISMQLFKKEFNDIDSKKAYLKACKWVAVNIINKVEANSDIFWKISKKPNTSLPTFVLDVHITIDTTEYENTFSRTQDEYRQLFYNRDKIFLASSSDFVKYLDERIKISAVNAKEKIGLEG